MWFVGLAILVILEVLSVANVLFLRATGDFDLRIS